jgi:hypothetical protein
MIKHFWRASNETSPLPENIEKRTCISGEDSGIIYTITGLAYKSGSLKAALNMTRGGINSRLLEIGSNEHGLTASTGSNENITHAYHDWKKTHSIEKDDLDALVGFCDAYAWNNFINIGEDVSVADIRGKHASSPVTAKPRTVRKRPSSLARA